MYDAVGMSDVAMVASGTATLETALLQTPMVITYKISPLTAAVGKRLIRVQHIGLVNIIAGKALVPELVQDDATAEKLAAEVKSILSDRQRSDAIRGALAGIRQKLGEPGASRRAAELALGLMTAETRDQGPGSRVEGEKT
jgi:lipid-A-disaccharide synthase